MKKMVNILNENPNTKNSESEACLQKRAAFADSDESDFQDKKKAWDKLFVLYPDLSDSLIKELSEGSFTERTEKSVKLAALAGKEKELTSLFEYIKQLEKDYPWIYTRLAYECKLEEDEKDEEETEQISYPVVVFELAKKLFDIAK